MQIVQRAQQLRTFIQQPYVKNTLITLAGSFAVLICSHSETWAIAGDLAKELRTMNDNLKGFGKLGLVGVGFVSCGASVYKQNALGLAFSVIGLISSPVINNWIDGKYPITF